MSDFKAGDGAGARRAAKGPWSDDGLDLFEDLGVGRYGDQRTNADRLNEECGVFGIFRTSEASALTALGLHALQHRGQEAAGIVTYDGRQFHSERRMGLVGDSFNKQSVIDNLKGQAAIGHVRYSTTGDTVIRNVQPLFAELSCGGFTVCHNGNLTNSRTLRQRLVARGAIYQSTTDTEAILHLIAHSDRIKPIQRFIDALTQIEGAYALVAMTEKMLIGARDPDGIRPLVLGRLGDAYILTSETCALDIVGAQFVREIENGEVVAITDEGIQSHKPFPPRRPRPCIFEYIYFSRPDSILDGKCIYEVRKNMGAELAREAGADVDLVIPIPDSGVPAAIGYANEAGLPFELGIIRNHYVGRTFIEPEQSIRQLGVRLKHSANRQAVKGKRVVLIDDSVVRGTTSKKIVDMMFEAGAREVHMGIACPPITHPDFYGIDTPDTDELLASHMSVEEMRTHMGATSLAFLSIDGLYRGLGHAGGRDAIAPQYTDHCFTGDYPTPLTDRNGAHDARQLSLLAEAS